MNKKFPIPPKLFFCKRCKVYFFTYSYLEHPTHYKCHTHENRLATQKQLDKINEVNGTSFKAFVIETKKQEAN